MSYLAEDQEEKNTSDGDQHGMKDEEILRASVSEPAMFEKYEGIEFKSWAYKITVNTAITHYRKLKRGEFLAEDPTVFEEPTAEFADARFSTVADAKATVTKVLDGMPGHLKSVLERYYLKDESYKTIAKEEKISIPTLKMRLFRAKKLFRKLNNNKNDE